jgi:hypothetical protein
MTRRMMLVVLSLMGLMVLVVTLSPQQTGTTGRGAQPAAPAPAQPRLTDPDAFDVTETLAVSSDAREAEIQAELGDRVEIVVEAGEPDAVALGALATRVVEAGIPARFELLAETPGTYPLILVNEDRRIGTLEIR